MEKEFVFLFFSSYLFAFYLHLLNTDITTAIAKTEEINEQAKKTLRKTMSTCKLIKCFWLIRNTDMYVTDMYI